ncbi:MAG: response regulator, partial [Rhodospirillaceae bacterium]
MRQMLIMMLKKAGITDIVQASDGDKAIEIAKSDKIGLMLLDYVMPTVGGLDVLKAIRSDKNIKNLPIILITANADIDVVTLAQKPETFANAIIV